MKNDYLYKQSFLFCMVVLMMVGCRQKLQQQQEIKIIAPVFNADSAYSFVKKQVGFGPRIPNSSAHQRCGDWYIEQFKRLGITVQVQNFTVKSYKNEIQKARNIIASVNPAATKRILLAAHWDTRPTSDKDNLAKNKAFDGADDGASGVAILLEIARSIQQNEKKPAVGIDFILFDVEDGGLPENSTQTDPEGKLWCMGSQYWANHPHSPNYVAYYGILLDMVGAKNAVFAQEQLSVQYAGSIVQKVWNTAEKLGFNNYFQNINGSYITDDHSAVNEIRKIPMIDILAFDAKETFPVHHHTQQDNLKIIDTKTLQAVGQTLLQVLYDETSEL